MTLIDLARAKRHLRLTWDDADPFYADEKSDLELKIAGAESAILLYVRRSAGGRTNSELWTAPDTTPADVQHATLVLLAEMWRFRGDDPGAVIYSQGRDPDADLPTASIGLLRRYCDPVLA